MPAQNVTKQNVTNRNVTRQNATSQGVTTQRNAANRKSAANEVRSASRIEYRPMLWDDIGAITQEFDRTWGRAVPMDSPQLSKMISRRFVLRYLAPSTGTRIACLDGRFMGATLVRAVGQTPLFPRAEEELRELDRELALSDAGRHALHGMALQRDIDVQMEQDSGVDRDSDAELELFLVAADARGHGVGGGLWRAMLEDFASAGVQRFHLHTDSDCDMGFYDHQRMICVAQRNISDTDDADLVLFAPEISRIYAGETERILGDVQHMGRTETDHTETSRMSRASRAAQLDITEQPNHMAAARKDGAR
ncbi:N-acetyltransferase [Bifidobacterium tibiigranuli]|jgi:GNAT superfamily N-acetyltransferase|uniref:N-acetyltransferase n=2 Tax=Bifidobacterium TaxID=1678 RepID=A0A5N6S037_9BIFI|nr:GNAT family N-acetyltransferase [Bifidobacterium tibiigranuli]KAE8127781.1 N-acetyltransferase [Bifidobacterium tibiigranuli]